MEYITGRNKLLAYSTRNPFAAGRERNYHFYIPYMFSFFVLFSRLLMPSCYSQHRTEEYRLPRPCSALYRYKYTSLSFLPTVMGRKGFSRSLSLQTAYMFVYTLRTMLCMRRLILPPKKSNCTHAYDDVLQ